MKKPNKPITSTKKSVSSLNRKAGFEVAVEERYTAGLVLTSDEIKSIRAGRLNLTGGFVRFLGGETARPFLVGLHLSLAKDPDRSRAMLLNTREINHLRNALQIHGKTAVPLKLFIKNGWAKVEIGVGSGRKGYQKRELLRRRDLDREKEQIVKLL